jgi:O-antigen ligase
VIPAEAARRLAAVATAAAAVVVPLIYLPQLEAPFLVPKLAALELAAALGWLAFSLSDHRRWSPPLAIGAALVLFTTGIAWALAARGPAGAPYALAALARWGALFGVAAGAMVVAADPARRQTLLEAITGTTAVVSAIGIVQHLEIGSLPIPVISAPGSTFGNRNLAAEAVAMSLPLGWAAIAGARGPGIRRALAAAFALALVYLAATRARGAWLGAGLGLGTLLLLARPRLTRRSVALAVAVVVVAALVGLLPGRLNPRFANDAKRFARGTDVVSASFDTRSTALRTRLGLWRRGLAMWRDHPLFGVGPGNWPVVFPRYAEPGATRDGVLGAALAPRQAHDDLIERADETGLLGLLALAALVTAVVLAVRRRLAADRTGPAAAAGALAALAGAGVTGFPLEMPAPLGLAGLALGLVAGEAGPHRRPRLAGVVLAAVLLIGSGVRAQQQIRGSAWLEAAERALHHDRGRAGAERALPPLDRAAAVTPRVFRVHLRTAQMMLRLGRHREAVQAARRALAVEPLSPNGWATLAAAQLPEQPVESRASAGRALSLLHDHPFALFVDAQAAEATGNRNAAAISWQRLKDVGSAPDVDEETARAARDLFAAHFGQQP